jgi:Ca2+-binding RTX toxin-like protein
MRSSTLLTTAVLAAAAALPGAAHAATLTSDGAGNFTYTAAPGEKNNMSFQVADDASQVVFYSYGVKVTSVPAGCTVEADGEDATCVGVKTASLSLGDGDDSFARSGAESVTATVDGGDGADWMKGGYANDTFYGGPGKDKLEGYKGDDVLDGGDGEDGIFGAAGRDTIQGGGGNDVISPDYYADPAADVIDGGPGIDEITSDYFDSALSVQAALSFTIGGGADDGRPGEGDDMRNVERLNLGVSPTLYVGTDGDDYLKVAQATNAGDFSGGLGNDDLNGADGAEKLDGGPGDDHLDGGFGDDVITGGPGKDRISGDLKGGDCGPLWCKYPYGNDIINAQDGEVDSIGCGFGTDVVNADAIDVVDGDCETVNRAGVQTKTTTNTTTNNGGRTTTATRTRAALAGQVTLAKALKKGFKVKVTGLPASKPVALSATRSGKVVAKGSAKADKKGTATVTLKFTAKAKKALRRAKTIKLKVSGGGATATVTLKRR